MTYWSLVSVGWCAFWVAGLVPRTTRRLVDAMSMAQWRTRHVWLLGILVSAGAGLASTAGLRAELYWAAAITGCIPYLLLTSMLAYRLGSTRHAGSHGSRQLPPMHPAWVDVDGELPVTWDDERYLATADALRDSLADRLAGTTGEPHTKYQAHASGFDLTGSEVRRTRIATSVASTVGAVAMVAWITVIATTPLEDSSGRVATLRSIAAAVVGVSLLALIPFGAAAWLRKRMARRRAARLNGLRVSWWMLASVHGWRLTRPGAFPIERWQQSPAFASLIDRSGANRPHLLTMSGRVGTWEVCVLAGQAGGTAAGLVAAVAVPGVWFPHLAIEREPAGDHDTFRFYCENQEFKDDVTTPEQWEYLQAALPRFADLVISGDAIALVLKPTVEPEPWRAEHMVACLVGVADRIPAEVLNLCLLEPSPEDGAASP